MNTGNERNKKIIYPAALKSRELPYAFSMSKYKEMTHSTSQQEEAELPYAFYLSNRDHFIASEGSKAGNAVFLSKKAG